MNNNKFEFGKFEIIAILRDAIKRHKYAILESGDCKIERQVLRVDSQGIYFGSNVPDIYLGKKIDVTMNNSNARYCFTITVSKKNKFEILNGKCCWILELPESIEICQRRKQTRISIASVNSYNGSGRSNKGFYYYFEIKNLSKGGCTVISKPTSTGVKFSTPSIGETFNNLSFDFGILGGFICNMVVVNKKIDRNGVELLSCEFKRLNVKTQSIIDNIITKLIVKSKK